MTKATKKKINLTVDRDIVELAHLVAEQRGKSLSSLVEEFLSILVLESSESGDWITSFHKKYLPKNYKDPSDRDVKAIKQKMLEKYL
jgi:Family of unknown function (DUF6364)